MKNKNRKGIYLSNNGNGWQQSKYVGGLGESQGPILPPFEESPIVLKVNNVYSQRLSYYDTPIDEIIDSDVGFTLQSFKINNFDFAILTSPIIYVENEGNISTFGKNTVYTFNGIKYYKRNNRTSDYNLTFGFRLKYIYLVNENDFDLINDEEKNQIIETIDNLLIDNDRLDNLIELPDIEFIKETSNKRVYNNTILNDRGCLVYKNNNYIFDREQIKPINDRRMKPSINLFKSYNGFYTDETTMRDYDGDNWINSYIPFIYLNGHFVNNNKLNSYLLLGAIMRDDYQTMSFNDFDNQYTYILKCDVSKPETPEQSEYLKSIQGYRLDYCVGYKPNI